MFDLIIGFWAVVWLVGWFFEIGMIIEASPDNAPWYYTALSAVTVIILALLFWPVFHGMRYYNNNRF